MNRNFIYASLLAAVCLNLAIIGCHKKGEQETGQPTDSGMAAVQHPAPDSSRNPFENSVVEIKTFNNAPPVGGFGYDIFVDSIPYVHQPHIPAIPGNKGFPTAEKAQRTAEFVAWKIKNNVRPPSVTPKELDSLGVLR